jgi:aldose 1-epimerase
MAPTEAIEIRSDGYIARLNSLGARHEKLTFNGRNLIEERRPDPRGFYCGDILAPWPNRIQDGVYEYAGQRYSVEVNEVARRNALHGLVTNEIWEVSSRSTESVTFSLDAQASNGYPFHLQYSLEYKVDSQGLSIKLTVHNRGDSTAPFGASIHPYLVADESTGVNQWKLSLPADHFMSVDSERLLPVGIESVAATDFDFRNSRTIKDTFIDHAFKVSEGLAASVVTVKAPSGTGVAMEFDSSSKWVQIHTADRDGDPTGRRSLAVEPMSCPPNAFNSGLDLVLLDPRAKYSISWRIKAI